MSMFNTSYQKLKQYVRNYLAWLWKNKIKILRILGYLLLALLIKTGKSMKKLFFYLWKYKKSILKFTGYSVFAGFVFVAFLFIYFSRDLPSRDAINDLFIPESTKIFDRTGTSVLYDIYDEYNRTVIGSEEIPDFVRSATIVAEDDNFYHHWGIDFKAIFRALLVNIKGGEIQQGGSTITQQYIKNLLLTPERTLARKIKEAILSVEMELLYTKDEILTGYLNYVPYGLNTYGIEAAAQVYFNKNAKNLTLGESAILASIPRATTYYSNNPDALYARQEYILNRMLHFGYITEEERNKALEEKIEFEQIYTSIKSPHFVIMVKQYLEQKYGTVFVQQAGLKIITTLDKTLQEAAEKAIEERAEFNVNNFNAYNAALVAIDPASGQILSMVGSKNYLGESEPKGCISGKTCSFDPQVNITMTLQQPGSAFKPFAYAAAFKQGFTPETIVYDIKTEFNPDCNWQSNQKKDEYGLNCYSPGNYDSLYFGPIPLKESLAQSRNIGSVKTLYLAGINNTIDLAKKLGVESLKNRSGYGLSLVLGGADVTLLEQVSAFSTFAARGIKNKPQFILKIEDKNGNVLEEFEQNSERVLEENIADQINYILSTNSLRARVFGENNYLTIEGLAIAAKTGTTQEFRDAWTVGYTQSLAAGVWVGNNNNKPMVNAPGASVAAPIWNTFFREAYANKYRETNQIKKEEFYFNLPSIENEDKFVIPESITTGKDILDGVLGVPHSILHYIFRKNPLDGKNSQNDPQYSNWEAAVQNWAGNYSKLNTTNDIENQSLNIEFLKPNKNSFSKGETIQMETRVSSNLSIKNIKIFLDNNLVYSQTYTIKLLSANIAQNFSISDLKTKNLHEIIVEVEDEKEFQKNSFIFTVE